jgi:hypothetical protein
MKSKVLFFASLALLSWVLYTGFAPGDESPRWNTHPSMRVNETPLTPADQYTQLPVIEDAGPVINEPQFINSPNGVYVVNTPFRMVPRTSGMQSEVIMTRHPTNQNILFGSANATAGVSGAPFSVGWYVSTNGGTSWFGGDTIRNSVGAGIFNFGDPGPTIDKDGRIIESFITTTGSMGASYSTNNGLNWASIVSFPGATTSADKNFSGTDDAPSSAFYGRSYTVYTEFAGSFVNRIVLTYTTNGGVSWSSVAPVSPLPSAGHFHQGCDIKSGPNGEVYVVWANSSLTNPFTEDSLGFAKSTNGGVNWTIARNNAANVNGNRTFNMMNNIRVAGFPRIDVDRTCGPRSGWIYVCVGEKNPGVAGDVSDITLYKSTNGGTTWSSGVRVNQDAFGNGKKQYMGAIRVDESGGVNVVYYDTRNTPTNDSAEVWMARSMDGGVTFTEMKVGDKFRHAPTGLPNVNSQYAGDYIGITSTLAAGNPVNGNQRIWPNWHANNTGIYQSYTAKVEVLPSNPCWGCEDFTNTAFTPNYFNLEYTGTQYWTRQTPSAYGAGSGSAKFDFFNASSGTVQSLVTSCEPTPSGYYLTFDEAYAPFSAGFPGPDSLFVESSVNGGTTYTTLARLAGLFPSGGELNTAPAIAAAFTPTSSQWRPKIYSLPTGTNKVRLRARSGFGNNLYVDNVCIQSLPAATNVQDGINTQGLWRFPNPDVLLDTFTVYLHRADFPNVIVDSAKATINTGYILNSAVMTRALSGNYYREIRHRNSILVWSANPIAFTRGTSPNYNFLTPITQSYGSNMAPVPFPGYYAMYSGDVNQDKTIDGTDVGRVDNDAANFVGGYVVTDLTGDNFVDGTDFALADNNAANFVQAIEPPGASPLISTPVETDNSVDPEFENDLQRQKYEEGKKLSSQQQVVDQPRKQTYKEYLEMKRNQYSNSTQK